MNEGTNPKMEPIIPLRYPLGTWLLAWVFALLAHLIPSSNGIEILCVLHVLVLMITTVCFLGYKLVEESDKNKGKLTFIMKW